MVPSLTTYRDLSKNTIKEPHYKQSYWHCMCPDETWMKNVHFTRLCLKICSKWKRANDLYILTVTVCRLLTLLCVVNRAVSTLCRRGQAPDAESEDQKGKVPPPPPGSHDARARWGEAGVMVVGRGSGEGKPPRYKCSTTRHLTQGTGWVCRSKQFTEVQWEKPGSREKKKQIKNQLHHQESNEMRQAVISRQKLSKTFPSDTRRLAASGLGKNVQTHVLAKCVFPWRCCSSCRGRASRGTQDRMRGWCWRVVKRACHLLSYRSSHTLPCASQTPLGPKPGQITSSSISSQAAKSCLGIQHLSLSHINPLNACEVTISCRKSQSKYTPRTIKDV